MRRLGLVGAFVVVTGLLTMPPASTATKPKMCDGQVATVVGTNGDDNLTDDTDPAPDIVWLGPGNDTWHSAGTGADIVCGGKGLDRLYASDVAALLIGGPGNDLLYELGPNTVAKGGRGKDQIEQYAGIAYGGPGDDSFVNVGGGISYGGPGNDNFSINRHASGVVHGGSGKDAVWFWLRGLHVNLTRGFAYWNNGRITLDGIRAVSGSPFDDVLIGSPGPDIIDGDTGTDLIYGRGGNDNLGTATQGGGRVYGGPGYDTCSARHTYGCENVW